MMYFMFLFCVVATYESFTWHPSCPPISSQIYRNLCTSAVSDRKSLVAQYLCYGTPCFCLFPNFVRGRSLTKSAVKTSGALFFPMWLTAVLWRHVASAAQWKKKRKQRKKSEQNNVEVRGKSWESEERLAGQTNTGRETNSEQLAEVRQKEDKHGLQKTNNMVQIGATKTWSWCWGEAWRYYATTRATWDALCFVSFRMRGVAKK